MNKCEQYRDKAFTQFYQVATTLADSFFLMHVNATQGQQILHARGEWSVAKALLTIEVIALRGGGGGGASKGGRDADGKYYTLYSHLHCPLMR